MKKCLAVCSRAARAHRAALLLALLVSFVYGSHHVFIARILAGRGLAYQPVTVSANRDEGLFYGHRVRAAYEGQWKASDIAVAGNEKSPWLLPIANPVILGALGRIAGSLERAYVLSDFLFPPLIFFLLYLLAVELGMRRNRSRAFATLFVFTPKVFTFIPPFTPAIFRQFIETIVPDPSNPLFFTRFEYPKVTFLFFALASYLLVRALRRGGNRNVIAAGVAAGILFYTYLYDWVYFYGGMGILTLLFLFGRQRVFAYRIVAVMGIGALVSIPYWVNFLALRQSPHYGDLAARMGIELGRAVRWETVLKSYARILALGGLLWFFFRKKDLMRARFLIAFLSVYFLTVNAQVVLGFNPHPDHWHRIQFLAIGLGVWFIVFHVLDRQKLLSFMPATRRMAQGIFIMYVFGAFFFQQLLFSAVNAGRYTASASYVRSYAWIRDHVPPGSVIGSIPSLTNGEFSLYVHRKSFLPNGFHTTVSNDEIWKRLMLISKIYQISPEQFAANLADSAFLLFLFHEAYRDWSFDSSFRTDVARNLPPTTYRKQLEEYRTFTLDPRGELPYRLDYLYWGPRERVSGSDPAHALAGLVPVYEREGVVLYQYRRP